MSDYDDKQGTWPAVYFIRNDLNREKAGLLDEMSDMGWVLTDETKERLKEISDRIEQINKILIDVSTNNYQVEE